MKILGTGLKGLVGSRIVELLQDFYVFENISRREGVDITDKKAVEQAVSTSDAKLVLHLSAKTDVDRCESDKQLQSEGEAWRVNVVGTENILFACQKYNKKLIFISTDFVFDGETMPSVGYKETDNPHPVNWYGETKFQAEELVKKASIPWVIVRISYPYRESFEKNDFVRAIVKKLSNGQKVQAVIDHLFSPTYIDDIAFALRELVEKSATGIYHVTGSGFLSPWETAMSIARAFHYSPSLIEKSTREKYFAHRATRPFQLGMNNDRIKSLGIKMQSFSEGLKHLTTHL